MKSALTSLHSFLERKRLLPSFDEDTVFLLAVSVIVVMLIDADARAFADEVRAHSGKIALMVLLGAGFAVYTAFFTYFKNETQKFYMFWFAVLVNFLSAFAAIKLLSGSSAPFYMYIAPAIGIGIFILMLIFWHADVLDASTLPHKSSSYSNILYGTLAVLGFVYLAENVWNLHWTSVLSTAIGYATIINGSVASHLPQIFGKRDEKINKLDAAVNNSIDRMIGNLNAGKDQWVSIATDEGVEDMNVESGYENNVETFLADRVRMLNRTSPVVAAASMGTYTFQKYAFTRTHVETAIIVDVYPNDGTTGYQFCQMVKYDSEGELKRYKGLMYLNKIKNIFT